MFVHVCVIIQDSVICKLEQQLKDGGIEKPCPHTPHSEHSSSELVQQQLQYVGCEGTVGRDSVRMVELVGRVEDLTFQLTTTQEELEAANHREAQVEVCS